MGAVSSSVMSTNNFVILGKAPAFYDDDAPAAVEAIENIDGNRFAVGGQFKSVVDSTGVLKSCEYCGIFSKEGKLLVTIVGGAPPENRVRALAYLGNNKLAIASDSDDTVVSSTDPLRSTCVIVDCLTGGTEVVISTNDRIYALASLTGSGFAISGFAMGGDFTEITDTESREVTVYRCAIFSTDGVFVSTPGRFNDTVRAINTDLFRGTPTPYPILVVGGDFTTHSPSDPYGMAPPPERDASYCAIIDTNGVFYQNLGFNDGVFALANLDNRRIAVGGAFKYSRRDEGLFAFFSSADGLAIFEVAPTDPPLTFSKGFDCGSPRALAYLGNDKLAVGGYINRVGSLPGTSTNPTTALAVINVDNGDIVKTFSNIDLAGGTKRVLALADLSNNNLVVGGVFTNMHNDCPGATGGSKSKSFAILNHVDTILKPTVQKPTEPVAHLSVTVPTPTNTSFTQHPSDISARNQAKANGQQTYYYAKGKFLCKKPEFCLDIEKRGFNNFKLSRK